MPAETLLGNMPQPGARRTFRAAELASIAQRYSVKLDVPRDVCFEWPMAKLDRGQMLEVMRASLQDPKAQIEITDSLLTSVPRGRLEFPRELLGRPASAAQKDPVLWRGQVIYGGDHRYAIWAKVRIKVACERLIALEALKMGQPVESSQVRLETGECFPESQTASQNPANLIGLVPTRALGAGAEIRPEFLLPRNDVNRGDTVEVDVRFGAAHLAFSAKAETAGRSGDLIAVRNPSSNKLFQARVEGKDRVVVQNAALPEGR